MALPTDPKKLLPYLDGLRDDPLKHFTKDAPGWKLAALVVHKIPRILCAIALIAYHWLPHLKP